MFNETRLLDKVAYGSEFGQEFNTRIVTLKSGVERRNVNWSMPLARYSVLYQALEPQDHIEVRNAHMASMGRAIPFRFKDWTDYKAEFEGLGVSDGTEKTVQLTKAYTFGPVTLNRNIKKPVIGTVQLFESDGVNPPAVIPATVDYITGIVTFTAQEGYTVLWSGEFDIPVRFSDDRLDVDPVALSCDGYRLSFDVSLEEVRL